MGLLFGWTALTELLCAAGLRVWPRHVSQAVAGLALLVPDAPSIGRLLLTLPGLRDGDSPIDHRSHPQDLSALVTALETCGGVLAADPSQFAATGGVCDILTKVGRCAVPMELDGLPMDSSLRYAAARALLHILEQRPRLARSRAASLRSYVQTSESRLRDEATVRAWDVVQRLRRVYLAHL